MGAIAPVIGSLSLNATRNVANQSAYPLDVPCVTVDDLEFGRLVRNIYKVLLTRGLSVTIIYSTDEETRDKLRTLVQSR